MPGRSAISTETFAKAALPATPARRWIASLTMGVNSDWLSKTALAGKDAGA